MEFVEHELKKQKTISDYDVRNLRHDCRGFIIKLLVKPKAKSQFVMLLFGMLLA